MHRNSPKPNLENSPAAGNIFAVSALLATPMTSSSSLRRSRAIVLSNGTRPSRISTINRTRLADSIAWRICCSIWPLRSSISTIPYPPVSISSKYRSPFSMMVLTRSLVTPAVGSTILIIDPASAFKRLLLPTFGRPIIVTFGKAILYWQFLVYYLLFSMSNRQYSNFLAGRRFSKWGKSYGK